MYATTWNETRLKVFTARMNDMAWHAWLSSHVSSVNAAPYIVSTSALKIDSMFLLNVGIYLQVHTALLHQHRHLHSRENQPQISYKRRVLRSLCHTPHYTLKILLSVRFWNMCSRFRTEVVSHLWKQVQPLQAVWVGQQWKQTGWLTEQTRYGNATTSRRIQLPSRLHVLQLEMRCTQCMGMFRERGVGHASFFSILLVLNKSWDLPDMVTNIPT
jgi:hypothetical protein